MTGATSPLSSGHPAQSPRATKLEQLIAEGNVTPAPRRKGKRPAPVKTNGTVSDLIDQQRR